MSILTLLFAAGLHVLQMECPVKVRSMVGFLIRVGLGEERPCAVTELLEGHVPRTARVPTATGRGLFLWKVFYR